MTSKEDLKMIKIKCHPNANPNPMIDEALNNVEKDLEDYERLKELMGTPIQDIMKRLKTLEILKNKQVNIHFDLVVKDTFEEYLAGVEGSKVILTEKEWNELKEWLKNEE